MLVWRDGLSQRCLSPRFLCEYEAWQHEYVYHARCVARVMKTIRMDRGRYQVSPIAQKFSLTTPNTSTHERAV